MNRVVQLKLREASLVLLVVRLYLASLQTPQPSLSQGQIGPVIATFQQISLVRQNHLLALILSSASGKLSDINKSSKHGSQSSGSTVVRYWGFQNFVWRSQQETLIRDWLETFVRPAISVIEANWQRSPGQLVKKCSPMKAVHLPDTCRTIHDLFGENGAIPAKPNRQLKLYLYVPSTTDPSKLAQEQLSRTPRTKRRRQSSIAIKEEDQDTLELIQITNFTSRTPKRPAKTRRTATQEQDQEEEQEEDRRTEKEDNLRTEEEEP
ncbi:uncharacterized protein B0I36DRAFT_84110 [Microdochium trichocladiopsis]|uniref:Uncharacterized protein n=1 Tax=Microdochium trichocladiopsis TaxID=1682393 RepID=A0A9P8YDC4_9PEZI|nr:uncharacterized protein B0I36DRAFT_84110 [Microdochium trichocladiopsis]KAH7034782.1 hypothetical protein B0I36DRAFT_84110 [Microdochium trichocladiopsis]